MKDDPHYLSRFHMLVRAAHVCSDRMDSFDLANNSLSAQQYGLLRAEEEDAALALIDFIVAHHRELYKVYQDD